MRYQKQEKVIGSSKQMKLVDKRVLIVGLGALGSVVADLLARAGIGHLYLMDADLVELSNLQRQSLYTERDAAEQSPKVFVSVKHLYEANSEISYYPIFSELNKKNAVHYIEGMDIIIDGTDNAETRYVINDACLALNVPWIHGAAASTTGTVCSFIPKKTLCYRCLFGNISEGGDNCSFHGVLAPTTHMIASLQANEALKWLTGNEDKMMNTFNRYDMWTNQATQIKINNNNTCHCTNLKKIGIEKEIVRKKTEYIFKLLCGKEVVMGKVLDQQGNIVNDHHKMITLARRKGMHVKENQHITIVTYDGFGIRLLKNGYIHVHCDDVKLAVSIIEKWHKESIFLDIPKMQ